MENSLIYDKALLFDAEMEKYRGTTRWSQCQTNFLRNLQQRVSIGDTDELLNHLRQEKINALEVFKKTDISHIWDTCFEAPTRNYNKSKFIQALQVISDGNINFSELIPIFEYLSITEIIDNLIQNAIILTMGNKGIVINANNIQIINGNIEIYQAIPDEETETFVNNAPLKNIIFSNRIFDSDKRLTALRNAIAAYVDLGQDNGKIAAPSNFQINPSCQNEWYYILLAISESKIVIGKKLTDTNFFDQMVDWFPWLFHFDNITDLKSFKRKFTKSISAERRKWKYGRAKTVTAISDMWAKYVTLGIDESKVARMYPIAKGLKEKFENLMVQIQKENNIR